MGEVGQLGAVDSLWFWLDGGGWRVRDARLVVGGARFDLDGGFGEVRDARWVVGGARFTLDGGSGGSDGQHKPT